MKEVNSKKKVAVALSGGVDSSVAALLLLRAGYEVTGVFMKCWSDTKDKGGQCTWKQDYKDAFDVAAKLGIKFRAVDFESEYKNYVFGAMLEEYEAGHTPNPDILCNKVIKFNALLKYAKVLGADYLATGHHARKAVVQDQTGRLVYKILAGKDPLKDQSYFLSELTQEQLADVLFPIGEYTKAEVREIARQHGLKTADKRSTRGICFVGKQDFQNFLQKYLPTRPGKIVDTRGRELGEHIGLAYYTIGQRYGLKISAQSPNSQPYYVVAKDLAANQLIVDQGLNAKSLMADQAEVVEGHWISGIAPEFPLKCKARIRYRQPLQDALVDSATGDRLLLNFVEPQRAVTPGQVAAFYQGEELIGSGVIV